VCSTVARVFNFERKSFVHSLCIGVTFNFENQRTPEEMALREFAKASIYHQDYFKEIQDRYQITLENLVYYQGETHYFVTTIKKESLCQRGVFKEEKSTTAELLDSTNINPDKLLTIANDIAAYCGIPSSSTITLIEGVPDLQLFDFSARVQSTESAKIVEAIQNGPKFDIVDVKLKPQEEESKPQGQEESKQEGHQDEPKPQEPEQERDRDFSGLSEPLGLNKGRAIVGLVGDALLEPFWPLGTGANRALLSALDASWMVQEIAMKKPLGEILQLRQGCYRKMKSALAETFPEPSKVCINPSTRYNSRLLTQNVSLQ